MELTESHDRKRLQQANVIELTELMLNVSILILDDQ